MVESAGEARARLAAMRYPPKGRRGVASSIVRASGFGADPDYFATADAQMCLIVQVENRAGLAALDDILAVEGVDGFSSARPISPPTWVFFASAGEPEARAAVMAAIAQIAASGKWAGVLSFDPGYLAEAEEAGALFLGVAADIAVLRARLREVAASHR